MDADCETIPDHSPDGARRLSTVVNLCGATTSALRDGFGQRRRCVTMSALPDGVAMGAQEGEKEEQEEGEGQEEGDVLWMGSKDGDGVEEGFEMRVRAKTSPACMRWYVERQVGRHLRRISDDFNHHIPQLARVRDPQQSDVSPQQPEVQSDSRQFPAAVGGLPPSSSSSSRNSLWSRMVTYFRPYSERVNRNVSNGLSTEQGLEEVFEPADVENSLTVAMQ